MFPYVTVPEYLSYYCLYTAQNLISLSRKLYNIWEMRITHEKLSFIYIYKFPSKNVCSNKYLASSRDFVWDGCRNVFCLCNFSLSYFKLKYADTFHQYQISWKSLAVLNLLDVYRWMDKHGERNAAIFGNFPRKRAKKNNFFYVRAIL